MVAVMKIPRTVLPNVEAIVDDMVVDNELELAAKFRFCRCTALLLPRSFCLRSGEILASELNRMKFAISVISRKYGNLKSFVETHLVVEFLYQVCFEFSLLAARLGGLLLTKLRRKPYYLILSVPNC